MFFEDLADIQTTLPDEAVMNELYPVMEVNEDKREDSEVSRDSSTSFEHLEYRDKPRKKDIFVDQ